MSDDADQRVVMTPCYRFEALVAQCDFCDHPLRLPFVARELEDFGVAEI